ncbi:MAG: TonB-dependent receptor [Betaproteobacteria bacterium]|nr:MAG: TonB-dependent receptor [Betaproteobacteria bacterium]
MKRSIIAALIVAAAPFALAQSPENAVVVTAARLPQARSQTLQPVKIITAEDIAQGGQQTVVEILQTLGGVEIVSNGGFGQPSSVFMRGANSGHTLVLVDGMRIGSATLGTTAMENIPLSQIERIEVVPGELSSLYGSDAIGGVIQIFTKSGKYAPATRVTAGVGTYGTGSVSGGVNSTVGDTDFSLNFGYLETRGFDATKPGAFGHAPDRDGYRNENFSGKIAHHLDARNELGLTVFQSDGRTHLDNDPTIDAVNHQTLSVFSLYSSNQITGSWQSLVRAGESQDKSTTTGAFPNFFETRQPQFTWQNDIKLGPGTAITGAEYLEQHVTSDSAFAQNHRTIKSAFAGYVGTHEKHDWQANIRRDDNSQFGNHATGLLGYAYRLTSELRLRVGAGSAFKAPTFNDLYLIDPFFIPNPDLRPERSRSKETGLNYRAGTNRFSATYFENHITDLVVFVSDPVTFVGTVRNLNRARIKGTELGYQGFFGGVQASAQLTLQDPVDEETGKLLPRRAREYGSVAAGKAAGRWRFGAEVTASGARFDSADEDPAKKMHGYALVNLTASYTLSQEWLLRARWNNVFNREYELAQNFNTPGSNVFVALQYQPR